MQANLVVHEFKGTTIKTPFEKMRANAIINAKLDPTGISLIHFNITTFLPKARKTDAFFILSLWSVHPIRLQVEKFSDRPHDGAKALKQRAEKLALILLERPDITQDFMNEALSHMFSAIDQHTAHLISINEGQKRA